MATATGRARRAIAIMSDSSWAPGATGHALRAKNTGRRGAAGTAPLLSRAHLDAVVRKAASRAMSIREWTSSFFRMWETWVATVRWDRNSLAAICGLVNPPSTSAAIFVSAGVRLSQPLPRLPVFSVRGAADAVSAEPRPAAGRRP